MRNAEPPVDLEYIRLRCKCDEESGCWEWNGYLKTGRQPCAAFRRVQQDGVIRPESWPIRPLVRLLTTGKQPNGRLHVMVATCGNPRCVAPRHIKQVRRGSYTKGVKKPAIQAIRISRTRSAMSKLSQEAVQAIRSMDRSEWTEEKAQEFGISRAYGYMLMRGQYRARTSPSPFAGLGAT